MKRSLKIKACSALICSIIFNGTALAQQVEQVQTSHIESNISAFLAEASKSGPGKPMEQMTPAEAQAVLAGAQNSVKVNLSGVVITEVRIPADGQMILLTIVKPAGTNDPLPCFVYFHGGGWMLGDFATNQRLIRDLVISSGTAAVFVNYALTPEAKYPTAINQAYAATKWVAEHGKEIGLDGKRIAVAGNSSGGNMAAVVAIMAKDKRGPKIKLQLLLWPITDANFDTGSYQQFALNPILTKNVMIWFWENYLPDAAKRNDIYASPLQATLKQLKGLPPAIVLTAENDVLRDEGEAYARRLDQAGVRTVCTRYNGMVHDWALLNPFSQIPAARAAIAQASAELKNSLQ
ncbi:alpha/beta hydrolase [Pedobacter sp. L105]|uniref:alpha/beta hydrolase n=1 Tax=Pedobacter sp. L105 TaxID=1641871 RepID=UPI00131CC605|nr:alpha/beta hydrolase [Pedobacter sp. L105]